MEVVVISYPKLNKSTGCWEFCIETKCNGKRKQIRRSHLRTKREATELYERLQQEEVLKNEKFNHKLTVKGFLDYWMETERKLQCEAVTLYNNTCVITKHIIPRIGGLLLNDLQLVHCQAIIHDMVRLGYKRNTIDRMYSLLKLAFNRAVTYGFIVRNPATGALLPKKVKQEKQIWSLDQVKLFLKHTKNDRFFCAYALALFTGMRMGEILGLRWCDIQFERSRIQINQTLVNYGKELKKGAKSVSSQREIAIPQQLISILRTQKMMHEQFFVDKGFHFSAENLVIFNKKNGRHVYPTNLALQFTKAVECSGLPKVTFHSMRHTHATLLLENNMNIKLVSDRLGHSKVGITLDTYSHVTAGMQQAVVDKLDELFDEEYSVNIR